MKTSIQKQFDILLVVAQMGCSKLEAIAASKGWTIKTLPVEKAEEIEAAVKVVVAKRTKAVRVPVKGRRPSRKAKTFPRFVGSLVVAKTTTVDLTSQIREVKAQTRAKTVAVRGYIKALGVAQKAASKVSEVKSKTVGWSVDLLKAMSKDAQAKVALEAAKAAL